MISAFEIDEKKLLDYYNLMYPDRKDSLATNWKWQNRTDYFDQVAPLVIYHDKKVIAHLGMIPFEMLLDNEKFTAQWLIDFSVHPEYRRKKLGHLITKKWMSYSDIHLTCCNERAINIFRKLGWEQSQNSYLHYIFIRPFNYKKIGEKIPFPIKKFMNAFSSRLLDLNYNRFSDSVKDLKMKPVNEKNILTFKNTHFKDENIGTTLRNKNYLTWRFLNSPDIDQYRIVGLKEMDCRFLIKLSESRSRHIDVLMQSEPISSSEIIRLIATLASWGKINNFDYIEYYTSRSDRSKMIKKHLKSFSIYQIYAYHSFNPFIFQKLKNVDYYWDYMDSDFEKYHTY